VTGGSVPPTPQLLEDDDFVWSRVWPLLSFDRETAGPGSPFELAMHRIHPDGRRAVAEYTFEGRLSVVAKLYGDAAEASAAYQVLCSLWRRGFGPRSLYRVAEPIAHLPDHGVVVMRAAPGNRLRALHARGREELQEGLRKAARWLVALHASRLRLGPREDVAYGVSRLARRASIAIACRADLEDFVRRAMEELARRGAAADGPKGPVQTHGRYHAEHVFLAPHGVTVIDLDRAAVADPMKDVGEFLHRLRWQAAREGWGSQALEESTDAFLSEYARHRPVPIAGLTYHWSYSILWTTAVGMQGPPG
jgi:hypothetical protein